MLSITITRCKKTRRKFCQRLESGTNATSVVVNNMIKVTLALLAMFAFSLGCGFSSRQSLDRETTIALRGALGELTEFEKQSLLEESNGVLLRLSDPSLRKVMQLFAGLPASQRRQLQKRSFLKWQVSELDTARQELLDTSLRERMQFLEDNSQLEETLGVLHESNVGFIEVELPSSGALLVSFYILWANGSTPSYVTIVGSVGDLRAVDTSEYDGVHERHLRMIRSLANSELPPANERP